MTQTQLLALGGFVIFMSLAMFFLGLSRRRKSVNIEERLAQFAEADRPFSVVDEELSASFSHRVLKPVFKKTILKLAAFTPTKNIEKTKQKLAEAGNPSGLGVAEFMGLRLFLALALA